MDTSFESQRFRGHEHDIRALISTLHLVLALFLALLPACAGGEVKTRCFVGAAADVSRAHDAMAIRDGEVKQTPLVTRLHPLLLRRRIHKLIDTPNSLQHRPPQHRVSKPLLSTHLVIRMTPLPLQTIQKQRKRPLTVRTPLHAQEPFLAQTQRHAPFHVPPASDVAVVHEHEAAVGERVAVGVGEGAFGCGADVGEDEGGGRFGSEARKVDAVPGGGGGGEDAGGGAEGWGSVVTYAEAVAVVGSSVILEMQL